MMKGRLKARPELVQLRQLGQPSFPLRNKSPSWRRVSRSRNNNQGWRMSAELAAGGRTEVG